MKIKDVIQLIEAETVDQRVQRATKTWTDEWNQLPQQNKTPQGLQQFGMDLAKDKSGKQLFTPALPQSVDPKSVATYISNILSNVFSTQDARQTADITAAEPIGPANDIKDTLDPEMQYRFPHPDYPGTQIIVRSSGWYIDKLPVELRGQVRRDKTTGLYPVLQPNNIKKYNLFYNQAAENNQVREEPAAAL